MQECLVRIPALKAELLMRGTGIESTSKRKMASFLSEVKEADYEPSLLTEEVQKLVDQELMRREN